MLFLKDLTILSQIKYKKAILFIAVFICVFSTSGLSQSKAQLIDSLKKVVKTQTEDTIKAIAFSDLCYYYRFISVDSALYFGEQALKKSIASKFKKGEAQAYNDLGIIYSDKSEGKKAIELYNKSMAIREQLKDSMGLAACFLKIGIVNQKEGETTKAIENQQKALNIYEKLNYTYGIAHAYNNIAILHFNQGMNELAMKYYNLSLDAKVKIGDKEGAGGTWANIGNVYLAQNDTLGAKNAYLKSLPLIGNSNKSYLASVYNNLSSIYISGKEIDSALYFCNLGLNLRHELSDTKGLASSYANRAEINNNKKNFKVALTDLNNAEKFAKESNAIPELYRIYRIFSDVYNQVNDKSKAYEYLYQYISLKDSIENEDIALKLSELQTKYETEKKEQQIKIQELTIAEQETELKKNRIQVASSVGGIIVLIVVLGLLYNAKRLREQVLALETAQKLQLERDRISSDLHDHVGAQLTSIISGLQMTETVGGDNQTPQFKQLVESLKEDAQVTITHLRDTIWTLKEEEIAPSEFAEHIQKFALSVLKYREKPVFNIQNTANDELKLNPTVALNLTRVVEEAIHNAIKHAEAESLTVSISIDKNEFKVSVSDTGKGFNMHNDQGSEHYGLQNMSKRAREVGGTITIHSKEAEGTSIEVSVYL